MKKVFTVLGISLAILFTGQVNALSQTPAGSDFYYVGDTKECEVIDYMCESGWDAFSDSSGCGCKKVQDPDIVCTMEYAPVCGVPYFECPDGAVCAMPLPVTYSNKCHLDAAGATFLYEGVCEHEREPKACPENWDPVCGRTQAKACLGPDCAAHDQTYSNMCFLESDNAEFLYEGKCEERKKLPEPTKTKYYVGDTKMCQMMKYSCEEGWRGFSDDIGCGCEKVEDDLPATIKARIEAIIQKFIDRLENKGYSEEKIHDSIALVIVKIELLKSEKPKYASILNYTIEVLKKHAERYEDDLNIIKKIFQDF